MTMLTFTAGSSLKNLNRFNQRGRSADAFIASLGVYSQEFNMVVPQDNCFWWGNWCGEGCSGPSGPIDDLDACCKAHDECYDRNPLPSARCDECDTALIACAAPHAGVFTSKGRAATAITAYFSAKLSGPLISCIP